MEIPSNFGRTLADIQNPGSQRTVGDSLGQQDFLRLMVEQMRNQNPLDPQDNGEFITQIAQFDTLSAMQELVSAVTALSEVSQLANASALIGRTVTAAVPQGADPETGFPREPLLSTGIVDRVTFEGGSAVVHMGNQRVPSELILEVA